MQQGNTGAPDPCSSYQWGRQQSDIYHLGYKCQLLTPPLIVAICSDLYESQHCPFTYNLNCANIIKLTDTLPTQNRFMSTTK